MTGRPAARGRRVRRGRVGALGQIAPDARQLVLQVFDASEELGPAKLVEVLAREGGKRVPRALHEFTLAHAPPCLPLAQGQPLFVGH